MAGNNIKQETFGISWEHQRQLRIYEEDLDSNASNYRTSGLRELLPTPKRENTIMTAFLEAGLTSVLPILSVKTEKQVVKSDSEEEKSFFRPTEHEKKRRMNKKMRVVQKAGVTNVTYKNISQKKRRYFSDLYTTLLDASWANCVLLFSASFFISWFIFAILYFVFSILHGDLEEAHLPKNQEENQWTPCILGIDGFLSCFLFSLETQHTIGYGVRAICTRCPDVVFIVSIQCVFGLLVQSLLVGLVFSKLSRPRMRTKTVMFSRNAVINLRNRKLCLIFRIGDLRDDNFILGTQITAKVLRRRITQEGEIYQEMQMLKVEPNTTTEPCIFFVWPLEVIHIIDQDSPLYEVSACELCHEKIELIAVMEGTSETSSMTFQAKTSYLPKEIYWGHRFEAMTLYRSDHKKYEVNFATFHSTYEVDTPLCCAKDLDNYFKLKEKEKKLIEKENRANGTPVWT